jgi:precorrin-6B methylase 2
MWYVIVAGLVTVAFATQAPRRPPDIHYTPTRHEVAEAMLDLARVDEKDVVYDLGSGDGRLPIIAAQKYGARGVGIEIDPTLVELARQNARDAGVADRVTFIEGDLFAADISAASVVTLYLSTTLMQQLEPKLKAELRPGTRIVSHHFWFQGWPAERTQRVDSSELFVWRIPGR